MMPVPSMFTLAQLNVYKTGPLSFAVGLAQPKNVFMATNQTQRAFSQNSTWANK
jgi:hypothetical protein